MAVRAGATLDWGQTSRGFAEALLDAGITVTKNAAKKLGVACEEAIKSLDWMWPRGKDNGPYKSGYRGGDADHPWYTGNLHDSVACGVADGTRLLQATASYMPPAAKVAQHYKGQIVDGAELGPEALQRAAHTFGAGVGGLRAIMVVGVPYADLVNSSDAHFDFMSELSEYFVGEVKGALVDLPKQSVIAKPRRRR